MDQPTLTFLILAAVVLLIAGIVVRALLSSANPPQWLAFLDRRRAEGRDTRWKEWKDED